MANPFSKNSDQYAKYRPVYPVEIFEFLNSLVKEQNTAWDSGTGNGQCAVQLAQYFKNVYATDVSADQISHAEKHEKVNYSVQAAEQTNFPDHFFDLITVAQAIHWFDFEKFYKEVNRTLKPGGIIAVIGYSLLRISPEVDEVIDEFYAFTGPYWDPQRKYLDDHYRTIPFPFTEIHTPEFNFKVEWTLEHLMGFLKTWSAVKHFIKAECYNPVDEWFPLLKDSWGDTATRTVVFPLLLRVGGGEVSK